MILLAAPVYMALRINKFLKFPEKRKKYKELFADLKEEDRGALSFSVIFFARRYFIILVLTTLPLFRNTQIVC